MYDKLKEKLKESLTSVLPITLIVLVLSLTLVPMEVGTLALFLAGAALLILGMGLFELGAEMAMTPLGRGLGTGMIRTKKLWLIVLGCFFIREPALPRGQGSYFANILYGFRPAVVRDNPQLYLSLAALGVYCMSQQVYMP